MNSLEKKSFYSFLSLYIISSVLFISIIGYWYYAAQKRSLENETYYRLQHIADMHSGDIIVAHMQGVELKSRVVPGDVKVAYIDSLGLVIKGLLIEPFMKREVGYFHFDKYNVFVSNGPREHLGIEYVVIQSDSLFGELVNLKVNVIKAIVVAMIFIIFIAVVLAKLFMRPVRQRVEQIERFIDDVTHELNTPITALSMSTNQAIKQSKCSENTLRNISISTKQLYDIYSSLTYLNFTPKKSQDESVDMAELLSSSIEYYRPLCESKKITINSRLERFNVNVDSSKLKLLFGNLISNAIKYSHPNSTVEIELKDGVLSVKDYGIGIESLKQKEIFKRYQRATKYAGGFGVGLSIVKSIANEYGIDVELDSTVGKGSEFRLDFSKAI